MSQLFIFSQSSSGTHYTCIFHSEEEFITTAMWNHSLHIISESAQLLAPCYIVPLWPEVFWLESISESTSKKWACECAGLHRACDTVQAAFLISHVCCSVYENNPRSPVIDCKYCWMLLPFISRQQAPHSSSGNYWINAGRMWKVVLSFLPSLFTPHSHNFPCWVSKPQELLRACCSVH